MSNFEICKYPIYIRISGYRISDIRSFRDPGNFNRNKSFLKIIFLLNNPGKRENLIKNIPSLNPN